MTDTTRYVARRGREPWQNPSLGPAVDADGNLCDAYGVPFPEEVQRLRAHVLPSPGMSVDLMIRDAAAALRAWENAKPPAYMCSHCRDGKDLPRGYVCQRCGADNPSEVYL